VTALVRIGVPFIHAFAKGFLVAAWCQSLDFQLLSVADKVHRTVAEISKPRASQQLRPHQKNKCSPALDLLRFNLLGLLIQNRDSTGILSAVVS